MQVSIEACIIVLGDEYIALLYLLERSHNGDIGKSLVRIEQSQVTSR